MAKKLVFLVILNFTALAIFLVTHTEEYTEGVWSVDIRHCHLDYRATNGAVALACPGIDYIKLWPLPVEQPWQETPDPFPEGLPGGYAKRG